jgi:hypothetical protein
MPIVKPSMSDRAFALDKGLYGNVARRNVLGLANAPELVLDDTNRVAYFGRNVVEKIVDPQTGHDGLGVEHSLPLDVKIIGYQVLTQFGYTAEQQEGLMAAWLVMPQAQKDDYSAQWKVLDTTDIPAVTAFVTSLVTALTALQSA